ncbi:MAG: hypothetical protein FWC80_07015, partial [Firmicutes bacterium]|nr:hypothetical protein [Bacillota bacterium]
MKNSAKTNIRINKKTGVAIVYFLTIAALVLSSLFLGLNSPIGTTNAMSGPPMVAQRVTQFANGDAANSGNNFGMPTAFDHDFVVSHTGAQPGPGVHPYGT